MIDLLLAAFGTIFGYLVISYAIYLTYWQRQGVKARPYISLQWMRKPLHEVVWDDRKNYGKFFGIYGFDRRILIVNDPKIARDISAKELHKFPARMPGYLGDTSMIHSLFFMDANEDWKRIRSIVSPAFTSGKLKSMLTPIERIVKQFVKSLEQFSMTEEQFDFKTYSSAFTLDVIASCAYGANIDSLGNPNHPIVIQARKVLGSDVSFQQAVSFMFPFIGKLLKLEPIDKEACEFFDNLTFKIIEERSKHSDHKSSKDLIGLMMDEVDRPTGVTNGHGPKKGISRQEIAGQGVIFFLAGHDTTNNTLCHIVYNLIKHPEWQEKLFEELKKQDSLMDYELLRSLPLLNAIINETLRLTPPLLIIQRSARFDTTLLDTGIKIPAGTVLSFSPYVIHRDPEYFPDPEEFKPERFMGENSAESSIAFMPFGVGLRLCVGMRFAMNELRIALSNLILNYEFLDCSDLKLEYFKGNFLLSPKSLRIKIRKRQ